MKTSRIFPNSSLYVDDYDITYGSRTIGHTYVYNTSTLSDNLIAFNSYIENAAYYFWAKITDSDYATYDNTGTTVVSCGSFSKCTKSKFTHNNFCIYYMRSPTSYETGGKLSFVDQYYL